MSISPAIPHDIIMRHALVIARQNPEHPFGCVIVDEEGEIVAEGINRREENPIWHGEIDAINECAGQHAGRDWSQLMLYSTAEPCPMCMSAILWSGIGSVVFGTSIETLANLGLRQIEITCQELVSKSWNPGLLVTGGILEEQCDRLFQSAGDSNRAP